MKKIHTGRTLLKTGNKKSINIRAAVAAMAVLVRSANEKTEWNRLDGLSLGKLGR